MCDNHFLSHGRYVPSHLHLMVFELVKNSLRAVQERFMDSDKVAPPIRIIVADGIEDVTIKVCFGCIADLLDFHLYVPPMQTHFFFGTYLAKTYLHCVYAIVGFR